MISIIIPTLNEENYISATINHTLEVSHSPERIEIIVVDAGSSDSTLFKIPPNCKVYADPALQGKKYESLNLGISASSGDILIFLDADTFLPQYYDREIIEAMNHQNIVGGAFEFAFSKPNFSLRIIQALNRIRYRLQKEYFGDQAVFCRKDVANEIGGFPSKSIMESALFCRKLRKVGRLKLLNISAITSPRRFLKNGVWKVMKFDVEVWVKYKLGLSLDKYGNRYWSENRSTIVN